MTDGAVPIDIPRDRDGSFEPELIQKGQTRTDGMDDKIIGLYAAGLSTRDIRAHLEEVYGLRVSADLISRVTDAVLEEVSDWQNRALEPVYPIVFLDALRVKIRDAESRQVKNKAVYVALGVTPEGEREVFGACGPGTSQFPGRSTAERSEPCWRKGRETGRMPAAGRGGFCVFFWNAWTTTNRCPDRRCYRFAENGLVVHLLQRPNQVPHVRRAHAFQPDRGRSLSPRPRNSATLRRSPSST